MRAYLDLAKQPGDLPGQLIRAMKWSLHPLHPGELSALTKYVTMILKSLEPIIADQNDSANGFATELKAQFEGYFSFALDPTSEDFLPEYWTATYFDPVRKGILNPDEIDIVRAYLESINTI